VENHEKVRLVRCGDVNPQDTSYVDVIFVHGLTGDYNATWSSDGHDEETFWPKVLEQKLDGKVRVWSLNHDAPLLRISDQNSVEMNLGTDAPAILGKLEQHKIGSNPIVFVTHSLGGLLVKAVLRSAEGEKTESAIASRPTHEPSFSWQCRIVAPASRT